MAQGEDGLGPFSFQHPPRLGGNQMARRIAAANLRTAAREDILRQYSYYLVDKQAAATARRFLDSVESAVTMLCKAPGMGARKYFANPILEGLRSWPVTGFPAVRIYYLVDGDAVRILRVLHGMRDIAALLENETASEQ
jgi:plasmid stabilization system protein ParE